MIKVGKKKYKEPRERIDEGNGLAPYEQQTAHTTFVLPFDSIASFLILAITIFVFGLLARRCYRIFKSVVVVVVVVVFPLATKCIVFNGTDCSKCHRFVIQSMDINVYFRVGIYRQAVMMMMMMSHYKKRQQQT